MGAKKESTTIIIIKKTFYIVDCLDEHVTGAIGKGKIQQEKVDSNLFRTQNKMAVGFDQR